MTYVLTDDYLQSTTARCIPGAHFDRERKAWILVEPTARAAAIALRLYPELAVTYPDLAELRDSMISDVRPLDNASEYAKSIDAPNVRKRLAELGMGLYEYQSIDCGYLADVMRQHGSGYLGHERGLGKTLSTCALIDDLGCHATLIVAPNTAKLSVWAAELDRFMPWMNVVVVRNARAQRNNDLGYIKQIHRESIRPLIFVVHYEALDIIAGDSGRGWQRLGIDWDMIVCDEAHRLSNPKTKMHKALMKVPTQYKLALSGSIISNHVEELYGQIRWLYPDRYRSRWRDWNDRFIDYVDGRWGRIAVGVKPDQLGAMQQELGVFMVYRRKHDELDLPERTEQELFVDLSSKQRAIYNSLVEDSIAELDSGGIIKADEGLALLGRLRQVATGLSLVERGDEQVLADSTKMDLALDLIQDNEDEAFVVFAWYKKCAYEMAARLEAKGIGTYVVTGDTPHNKRAEYIADFQAGTNRVFIGTLSTLGESVTLHRASQAIFLDRSWNPSTNDQAADRIYRIGQRNAVTITHIIARDTVDEARVQPVIKDKASLRRLVLGG